MMADSLASSDLAAATESVVIDADVESAEAIAASSAEAAANPAEDVQQEDGVAIGLSALKELGVVHPQDMAGTELLEMIQEAGTEVTLEDAAKILAWTRKELGKMHSGRPLRNVFAVPDPVTPPPSKFRRLAARPLPDAR